MPYVSPVPPLVEPQYWRSLPRTLERPPIGEINPANIVSANPAYAGVAPDQVRDGFTFCGIRQVHLSAPEVWVCAPSATLEPFYDFFLMDLGLAAQPTHAFGVFPTFSAAQDARCTPHQLPMAFPQRRRVTLNPAHGALWAAYCSKLPPMPYAPMQVALRTPGTKDQPTTSVVRLPLVPLPLPFPPGFYFLTRYIYTRIQWHFIAEMILPVDQQGDLGPESPQLAPRYSMIELCCLARNVWGTYQNAVYLGMVDERLWEAIEFAWTAVLKAMEIIGP
ncbi:hypothetical protein K466DRAFT_556333 [Polyporus arcularius HHB13444]|uniref:Uncharacterized protein n=1 Tax=Polyporus arcularius HHB13444 TaxID=1314778 RepID=A0A5C3NZC1_9APHY|nr:hypothetical protein K466DRAFT_556333 [Polyporus arcularius HHB13444]